jgi:large subunit ribosomal protein L19
MTLITAQSKLKINLDDPSPHMVYFSLAPPWYGWAAAHVCKSRQVFIMTDLIKAVEAPVNPNVPELRPGDSVNVHVRIREGDRERVQEFRGTVIRIKKGGVNANFTVRRTASHGIGVERTFLTRSPLLEKVDIVRRAAVRRSKLYYLRDRTGKRARLKEKRD